MEENYEHFSEDVVKFLKKNNIKDVNKKLDENGLSEEEANKFINSFNENFRVKKKNKRTLVGIDNLNTESIRDLLSQTIEINKTTNKLTDYVPKQYDWEGFGLLECLWQLFTLIFISLSITSCIICGLYLLPGSFFAIIISMLLYTFELIILRWIVWPTTKFPESFKLSGFNYMRWHFIDRIKESWEFLIGSMLTDTLFQKLAYVLLGMKCKFNSRIKTAIRYPWLLNLRNNCIIKFDITRSSVARGGVFLRNHIVNENDIITKFEVTKNNNKTSIVEIIMKSLKPIYIALGYYSSALILRYLPYENITFGYFIPYYYLMGLIMIIICSLLINNTPFITLGDEIGLTGIGILFNLLFCHTYQHLLIKLFFKTKRLPFFSLSNYLVYEVKPSSWRNISIGKNTYISGTYSIGDNVTIGDNCNIGLQCEIDDNITIGNNCNINKHVQIKNNVPDGTTIIDHKTSFNRKIKKVPLMNYVYNPIFTIVNFLIPIFGEYCLIYILRYLPNYIYLKIFVSLWFLLFFSCFFIIVTSRFQQVLKKVIYFRDLVSIFSINHSFMFYESDFLNGTFMRVFLLRLCGSKFDGIPYITGYINDKSFYKFGKGCTIESTFPGSLNAHKYTKKGMQLSKVEFGDNVSLMYPSAVFADTQISSNITIMGSCIRVPETYITKYHSGIFTGRDFLEYNENEFDSV